MQRLIPFLVITTMVAMAPGARAQVAESDDKLSETVGGAALGVVAGLGPGLVIAGEGSVAPVFLTVAAGGVGGALVARESSRRLLWASVGAEFGFLGGLLFGFVIGEDKSGFPEALVGMTIGAIIGAAVTSSEAPMPDPTAVGTQRVPIGVRIVF